MKLHEMQQALEALGIWKAIKRASESGGTTITNVTQGGGGGTWGTITGDITDQTDLQTALSNKADLAHTHTDFDELKRYTFLMS